MTLRAERMTRETDERITHLAKLVLQAYLCHQSHRKECERQQYRLEINYSPSDTLWNTNPVIIIGTNPGEDKKNEKEMKDLCPLDSKAAYSYIEKRLRTNESKYNEEWARSGRNLTPNLKMIFQDAFGSRGKEIFFNTLSLNLCFFATRNIKEMPERGFEDCWPAVLHLLKQKKPKLILAYGNCNDPKKSAYSFLKSLSKENNQLKHDDVSKLFTKYSIKKCTLPRDVLLLPDDVLLYGFSHLSRINHSRLKTWAKEHRNEKSVYKELISDLVRLIQP